MSRTPALALWLPRDLVATEIEAAFSIQQWRGRRRFGHHINKLLSSHPLLDVSVVLPILLAFTLPFAGYPLLWCATITFFICFLVDRVVCAYTPHGLDPRVVPLSHLSPHGFPCFELALAASILLSISLVSVVLLDVPWGCGSFSKRLAERTFQIGQRPAACHSCLYESPIDN